LIRACSCAVLTTEKATTAVVLFDLPPSPHPEMRGIPAKNNNPAIVLQVISLLLVF
jgi:hypothetical protein